MDCKSAATICKSAVYKRNDTILPPSPSSSQLAPTSPHLHLLPDTIIGTISINISLTIPITLINIISDTSTLIVIVTLTNTTRNTITVPDTVTITISLVSTVPDPNTCLHLHHHLHHHNPNTSTHLQQKRPGLKPDLFRDACRIQTCDLLIRSQMLYSAELRRHSRPDDRSLILLLQYLPSPRRC